MDSDNNQTRNEKALELTAFLAPYRGEKKRSPDAFKKALEGVVAYAQEVVGSEISVRQVNTLEGAVILELLIGQAEDPDQKRALDMRRGTVTVLGSDNEDHTYRLRHSVDKNTLIATATGKLLNRLKTAGVQVEKAMLRGAGADHAAEARYSGLSITVDEKLLAFGEARAQERDAAPDTISFPSR